MSLFDKFLDYLNKINGVQPIVTKYHLLDMINKADDENIISNWLAFFLDPVKCGSNVPLNYLSKYFGLEISNEVVQVRREHYLNNKRRIDIVVKTENIWLVIENKIKSLENNEQTIDYFNYINNEAVTAKIAYIYLKPDYNMSKPRCEYFKILKYGELLKIWKNISVSDFNDVEYFTYFNAFLKIIERSYAISEEIVFDKEVTLYANSKKDIFTVTKKYEIACEQVKTKLLSVLSEIFQEVDGWIIRSYLDYIQVYKKDWANGVHYEIATWKEQRFDRNTSFERIIDKSVWIGFYFHAEGDCPQKIKDYAKAIQKNGELFSETYDFSDGTKCLESIKSIAYSFEKINSEYTEQIVNINKINKVTL